MATIPLHSARSLSRAGLLGRMIPDSRIPSLFLYPGLLVIAALSLYPFFYVVYLSLRNYYLATPQLSTFVGLQNYITVFDDANFWNSVWVTSRYIAVAVGLELILGFGIALLYHSKLRLLSLWRTTLLIPIVLTPIVAGATWKLMFNVEFGIVPYALGLFGIHSLYLAGPETSLPTVLVAEVWQSTPFVTLIFLAGLATLPVEAYEAAAVDGASPWQLIRYVTIPLMRPFVVIALVLRFIATFRTFDLIYIMTQGGPGVSTQDLALRVYETGFNNLEIGKASAMAVLFLIVAIVITRVFILRPLTEKIPQEKVDL